MGNRELSEKDLLHLTNHGIDLDTFNRYKQMLEKGKNPPELLRPCVDSDGIEILSQEEQETFIRIYETEAAKGRCSKFVPASGAATRMFQCLCPLFGKEAIHTVNELEMRARHDPELRDALKLFNSINRLPFFPELQDWCQNHGLSVEEILEKGPLKKLVYGILHRDGLGLGTLPKALIPFHRYGKEVRTAFEEHILEAVHYVRDSEGLCRIHFTVSKDHLIRFQEHVETIERRLARDGIRLDVSFSIQYPSTDTPAIDEKGELVRNLDGTIVLRPGGHGALLRNLQEYGGDIVFIKNVDNVARDEIKPLVSRWKKILGGMLIAMERDFNNAIIGLRKDSKYLPLAEEIYKKWKQTLPPDYEKLSEYDKRNLLLNLLDRPKRVCGMVKNVGQPGGGPFWVRNPNGWITKQIVEKAQIDFNNSGQVKIWSASKYFNPVDVVCALRNYEGIPYQLYQFIDSNSYIITEKLQYGKKVKVLEHPGLWNGSMAYWITIFVEVPRETFHPVKKVIDLITD